MPPPPPQFSSFSCSIPKNLAEYWVGAPPLGLAPLSDKSWIGYWDGQQLLWISNITFSCYLSHRRTEECLVIQSRINANTINACDHFLSQDTKWTCRNGAFKIHFWSWFIYDKLITTFPFAFQVPFLSSRSKTSKISLSKLWSSLIWRSSKDFVSFTTYYQS